MEDNHVIKTKDVNFYYGKFRALTDISMDFEKNRVTALIGPSGCGKSTLLHLLGAVDVPTSGTLQLFGRDALRLGDAERTELRLRHLGFVFQRFFLLPMLTAAENMSKARLARKPLRRRYAQMPMTRKTTPTR